MGAHQNCYGIPVLPKDDVPWYCESCAENGNENRVCGKNGTKSSGLNLTCVLCAAKDFGPLKRIVLDSQGGHPFVKWEKKLKNQNVSLSNYCHMICAHWIPDVQFVKEETHSEIKIDGIHPKRMSLKCSLCNQRGVCIQCAYSKCYASFHPSCLLVSKHAVSGVNEYGQFVAYCRDHVDKNQDKNFLMIKNWKKRKSFEMKAKRKSIGGQVRAAVAKMDVAKVNGNACSKRRNSKKKEKENRMMECNYCFQNIAKDVFEKHECKAMRILQQDTEEDVKMDAEQIMNKVDKDYFQDKAVFVGRLNQRIARLFKDCWYRKDDDDVNEDLFQELKSKNDIQAITMKSNQRHFKIHKKMKIPILVPSISLKWKEKEGEKVVENNNCEKDQIFVDFCTPFLKACCSYENDFDLCKVDIVKHENELSSSVDQVNEEINKCITMLYDYSWNTKRMYDNVAGKLQQEKVKNREAIVENDIYKEKYQALYQWQWIAHNFQFGWTDRKSVKFVEDGSCIVCFDGESYERNQIMFCEACNISVHQYCYGMTDVPSQDFVCDPCTITPRAASTTSCVLCSSAGGALKKTASGHWAHVVCILWASNVKVADIASLQGIDICPSISIQDDMPSLLNSVVIKDCNNSSIQTFRNPGSICVVCNIQCGRTVQCAHPNCNISMHPICGWYDGVYCIARSGSDRSILCLEMFCSAHTPTDVPCQYRLEQKAIRKSFQVSASKKRAKRGSCKLVPNGTQGSLQQRRLSKACQSAKEVSLDAIRMTKDHTVACDICFNTELKEHNIKCKDCGVLVHPSCAQLDVDHCIGDWTCKYCLDVRTCRITECLLCPRTGGYKARIDGSDKWAHVFCAMNSADLNAKFENGVLFFNVSTEALDSSIERCAKCLRSYGLLSHCGLPSKKCKKYFHPLCGVRSGVFRHPKSRKWFCLKHQPEGYVYYAKKNTWLHIQDILAMQTIRESMEQLRLLLDLLRRQAKLRKRSVNHEEKIFQLVLEAVKYESPTMIMQQQYCSITNGSTMQKIKPIMHVTTRNANNKSNPKSTVEGSSKMDIAPRRSRRATISGKRTAEDVAAPRRSSRQRLSECVLGDNAVPPETTRRTNPRRNTMPSTRPIANTTARRSSRRKR